MTGFWLVIGVWACTVVAWLTLLWLEISDRRRHRRWLDGIDRDLAQFRHPAGRDIPAEDRPDWGTL